MNFSQEQVHHSLNTQIHRRLSRRTFTVFRRGAGPSRRCLIAKNGNRGSIFSIRVGVRNYSQTRYSFKGATCMDSEERVQYKWKGQHEEEGGIR